MSFLTIRVARKFQGHWNYYGIIGNSQGLGAFYWEVVNRLHHWLNRRSQRRSCRWESLQRLLDGFRVPRPRIKETAREQEQRRSGPVWDPEKAAGIHLFGVDYVACRA